MKELSLAERGQLFTSEKKKFAIVNLDPDPFILELHGPLFEWRLMVLRTPRIPTAVVTWV